MRKQKGFQKRKSATTTTTKKVLDRYESFKPIQLPKSKSKSKSKAKVTKTKTKVRAPQIMGRKGTDVADQVQHHFGNVTKASDSEPTEGMKKHADVGVIAAAFPAPAAAATTKKKTKAKARHK